jgi:hypothetical protein
MGMRVASTRGDERAAAALEGTHPRFGVALKGVSGGRVRPQLMSLPSRSSYDARLPPSGFAGALPLPWLTKEEAGIGFLGLSCFGFFASRLPRFSPLAIVVSIVSQDLGVVVSVVRRLVEQMIEVGQHPVDQPAPTQIGCVQTPREQTQQIARLLDSLWPVGGGCGRKQVFEFCLSRVKRCLVGLDLGPQASKVGGFLGRHAAMRVKIGWLINHGEPPPAG